MAKGRKLGKQTATTTAASSATTVNLSEDMISEILVKLPVKSLVRFRCVSKSWLNLIKSRNFIKMHLKHHSNSKDNECILVVRNREDITKGFLSFHSSETLDRIPSSPQLDIPHLKFRGLDVCGPVNGLICISDDTNIVLCNPSTREFKLLPLSPCLPVSEGWEFDRESIGFGFDSETNDFKVVTFVYLTHRDTDDVVLTELIEVYYLSTNSWKQYVTNDFPQHIERGSLGTVYKDTFNWVAWRNDELCILSYNISNGDLIYMPLPDKMFFKENSDEMDDATERCIKVINDCLAFLIYTESFVEPMFVEVWVMHKFGLTSSIKKDFVIGPLTEMREPLSIWKNEALLIKNQQGQLISCNLGTHQVNEFDIHGCISHTMLYKESLISLSN